MSVLVIQHPVKSACSGSRRSVVEGFSSACSPRRRQQSVVLRIAGVRLLYGLSALKGWRPLFPRRRSLLQPRRLFSCYVAMPSGIMTDSFDKHCMTQHVEGPADLSFVMAGNLRADAYSMFLSIAYATDMQEILLENKDVIR